jgi:hypothetical protein
MNTEKRVVTGTILTVVKMKALGGIPITPLKALGTQTLLIRLSNTSLSLKQILMALTSMPLKEESMAIGSTIAHRRVVTGSMKNLVTVDTGNTIPMITQLELGTAWIGLCGAHGILILMIQLSSTLSTMVSIIQVALTQTMESQTRSVTRVLNILQILAGVTHMIQRHLLQVRCAVLVEEVL